jgi:hypothetical protein
METTFYIVLNIKTPAGFERYGSFSIGQDKDFAYALFKELKGIKDPDEKCALHMDFMETRNGLPLNLQVIGVTLQQLAENCKIVAKETFRRLNLEET